MSTVTVVQNGGIGDVVASVVQAERRPPLYFVLLFSWLRTVGFAEINYRLFSVFWALVSLPVLYQLGATAVNRRAGLLSTLLFAVSPFLILYARMARYYSLTIALALLSCLFFLKLLSRGRRRDWAAYLVASLALVATDYPALAVIITQNLLLFTPWGAKRRHHGAFLRGWALAQSALLAEFLIWLGPLSEQMSRGVIEADLARTMLGFFLKLGYPLYSFSVGETIFPWHPLALVGFLGALSLAAYGLWRLPRGQALLLALLIAVPILATSLLLTFIATDIPFLNVPSRTAFAAPIFALAVAAGWQKLTHPGLRIGLPLALFAAIALSLTDYYSGHEFHNPIYAVPMREIATQVREAAQPNDVIVSEWDTAFPHYYESGPTPAMHFTTDQAERAQRYIVENNPPHVWLITMGRDRTRVATPTAFLQWLQSSYRETQRWEFVPQDPLYRQVKERLLGREVYEYKITLRLYVRQEEPT
ncbi:MAG: glycosyltransferase family 39 protein [Chloroflexi bacterium]|nr:glycosyltransferase family 39 protein [Chloroflexota bacterium]